MAVTVTEHGPEGARRRRGAAQTATLHDEVAHSASLSEAVRLPDIGRRGHVPARAAIPPVHDIVDRRIGRSSRPRPP
jgi:hypothetical protein